MPEEEKKMVDIDTSGPDATVDIEEKKDEAVIEQQETTEQGTDKTFENERETKLEEKKDDDKLEDYSKGVQARIAKLTRKMREAERREQAAVEYARAVEDKRLALISGTINLISFSILHAEELSITVVPAEANFGAHSREVVPPAENKAISGLASRASFNPITFIFLL